MQAEVISIGDELTTGQRLDTNSQWLSQRLGELGVRVAFHTTVGDDLAANVRVFREASDRADLVIATGGLGPTADDLTREALAEAFGRELEQVDEALAQIRALFARRKRPMPERNVVQARFPRGSRVVPNPNGTAPGIDLDVMRPDRTPARIFALPGVPAEMREMWKQSVAPAIVTMLGDNRRVIRVRTLNCFGVGESDLEAMLPDLIRRGRQPTVGIMVSKATISLRIVAEGRDEAECDAQIEPTVATIRECLGDLVFGEGEDELQHAVIHMLTKRQQSLLVLESSSGGLLTNWLSEADPSGQRFRGGFVQRNVVARTAEQTERLAVDARQRECVDFVLAISNFPAPNTDPPGSFHVTIASNRTPSTTTVPFLGHPDLLLPRAVKQALNALRLSLDSRL